MKRSVTIASLFLLIILMAVSIPACHEDQFTWKPDAVLILEPDSGLTTQTFDMRVNLINLPPSQNEFYLRWDLDGDSLWDAPYSSQPNLKHRFYLQGRHTVKVEILTEDGQQLTLNKVINIAQGYSPPHPSFTIDPKVGNYLDFFTFNASSTIDDEDEFSSLLFRWDFENDGIWDTESSSNPIVKFRYKKAAIYTIKLSVTDPTRRTASLTQNIEVNLHDNLIKPSFILTPQEATVRDTFHFDASATRHETDSNRIFTYVWDVKSEVTYGPFKEPVFNHVFWAAGNQEVMLTVTDQYGLSNSFSETFFVIKENKPPTPGILCATYYGNINTNFFLSSWPSRDDVTAPSQMLVRWDFESDGNWDTGWSYEKTLYHQFSIPGTYWVTLEAEDEGGERAIAKTRILVSASVAQTGFIQDSRDGKFYGTVKIGDQWWMSDNLDYRTNPKMDIPMLQKCYGEKSGQCDLYGALYQGARAIDFTQAGNNICPDGWHLPSRQEWLKLGTNIPSTGGRDAMLVGGSLGFNARYSGYGGYQVMRDPNTGEITGYQFYFYAMNEEVRYLSTTLRPYFSDLQRHFYFGLQNDFEGIDFLWGDFNGYFYARCIKNE